VSLLVAQRLAFSTPVKGFLDVPTAGFVQLLQPVLVGRFELQKLPAGMVPVTDVPPVIYRSP
jgi:hypothetical protein